MKKIVNIIICTLVSTSLFAQVKSSHGDKPKTKACPKIYLGITSGLNCGEGLLGLHLDAALPQNVSIGGGVGIGSWGYKMGIDARYYLKNCHTGWAFGAGLTRATGIKNGFSLTDDSMNTYNLRLNGITGLQLIAAHYWRIGRKNNRFNIQFGYNKSLSNNEYTVLTGGAINSTLDQTLRIMSPGGLMFGTSFSFGLGY